MVMDILFSVVKGIKDYMNMKAVVDILTKDLWPSLNNQRNAKIDYLHFLHCCECEEIESYMALANYTNIILYMKNDTNDSSYIIKRLLDNEKEYEYVLCSEKKFILKQCDGKCQCHEITKNERPKEITYCDSFKSQNVINCLVDGKYKEINIKSYFSLLKEVKIDKYYLMDYFCWNQSYSRGNYKNEEDNNRNSMKKIELSNKLIFLLILLTV